MLLSIEICNSYDCVFDDEICVLAKAMAKEATDASFVMEGFVDTSFVGSEYMKLCL